MKRRRHFTQEITLQDRIVGWAKEVRAQAAELPPGPDRDQLLKKETDPRAQRIQIFDDAVMPSILRQDLGRLCNLRSWESPTFNHVNPLHSQSAKNSLRYC
jgi:hypothetical protein